MNLRILHPSNLKFCSRSALRAIAFVYRHAAIPPTPAGRYYPKLTNVWLRCEIHVHEYWANSPQYWSSCTTCAVRVYHIIHCLLRIDSVKTNLFTFALASGLLLVGVTSLQADTIWTIGAEAPAYLINPSAAGIDVLEAFIVTPGVTFDSTTAGFVNLDNGWSAMIVNPTYAVEYGPLSSSLTEDLAFTGSIPPTAVDVYGFTGCAAQMPSISACPVEDLTDAYQATGNGGGYSTWTPTVTSNDLPSEDSAATPEPASILLIGTGVIGLAARRYYKR